MRRTGIGNAANVANLTARMLLVVVLILGGLLISNRAWAEEDSPIIADAPLPPVTQEEEQDSSPMLSSPTLSPLADTDPSVVNVLSDEGGTYVTRKAAIQAKWDTLQSGIFAGSDYYETLPRTTAPYAAGTLKPAFIQDALRHLNFARYLAGLPDDVTHDATRGTAAQTGAVLLAATGVLTHYPSQPSDMSQAFYDLGRSATSSANLAWGFPNMRSAIIDGWADDTDTSTIEGLGHRRWILNPAMAKTGFGNASSFYVMYSFDNSRTSAVSYEAIAYPSGQAFPSDVITRSTAWSITLNPSLYTTPTRDTITVKLTNGTNTWNFSAADTSTSGKYFNVNTSGYGVSNCIIFRPDNVAAYTGTWQVTVNGIKTRDGAPATLQYQVEFFTFGQPDNLAGSVITLSSALNRSRALDIAGASKTQGANLTLWDNSYKANQRFRLEAAGTGYYLIRNINSKLVLDVYGAQMKNSSALIQWASNGGDNQKWKFVANTNGSYTIVSKANERFCIDLAGGSSALSTRPILYERGTNKANQQFYLDGATPVLANGTYTLASAAASSSRFVDIKGASAKDGASAILWSQTSGNNQKFRLVYDSTTGYYTIVGVASGKPLDVYGASMAEGTSVIQWSPNGNFNQQWYIAPATGGSYAIYSAASGLALDVKGGSTSTGAPLIMWSYHGGANQRWVLTGA
jgi:uncharacterized protein YkwD